VVLKASIFGYRIMQDDFRGSYAGAIQFLRSNVHSGEMVMGSGELAFDLGFDGRVVDDCRLGFYTGKRPKYIVLDLQYYAMWMPYLAVHEPTVFRHVGRRLDEEYETVYDQKLQLNGTRGVDPPYKIYRLKESKIKNAGPEGQMLLSTN